MSEFDDAKSIQELQMKLRAGQVDQRTRRILLTLQQARRELLADVAETDWDRFYLPRLLAAVDRQLAQARTAALADVKLSLAQQWNAGATAVTETLDAMGVTVRTPEIATSLLMAMESKAGQRVTNLFKFAKDQIDSIISQTLLGGLSRDEAIAKMGTILEVGTVTNEPGGIFGSVSRRAAFILRQEMGAAYATAADLRREQLQKYVPDLQRVWAHDGDPKEPRQGHLLMHGQARGADEDFENPITGAELSFPRDPAADIGETANCTCNVYLWREAYGDKYDFIGSRSRGSITRTQDHYNPAGYVVPEQPVVSR